MRRAAALLLAALLLAAPPAAPLAAEGPAFALYRDERGAFSIEYPEAWTVFRGGADQVTFYDARTVASDDHPLQGFEVSRAEGGGGAVDPISELGDAARAERARFGAKNPLFALTEDRFESGGPLGPRYVLGWRGVRREGAEPQVARITFLRKGGQVFRLVGKATEARSEDFRALYDRMAGSLRLPDGGAPFRPRATP